MEIRKTAIIGVGLLGASLALALREKGLCPHIAGYGRTEDNLKRAKEKGIIDDYSLDAGRACMDADLVVLATPVGLFREIMSGIRPVLKKGTIITDVGSTKGEVVREITSLLPEGASYVGSHPIAGSDRSGIETASAGLFRDALCIVTPVEGTDQAALDTVESLWKEVGAKVLRMTPDEHDRVFSSVSHLPHVAAFALVKSVADLDPEYVKYAGQGFRDTTRIAMSSPEMWADICISNSRNLMDQIDILTKNLNQMRTLIEQGDRESLVRIFSEIRGVRRSIE